MLQRNIEKNKLGGWPNVSKIDVPDKCKCRNIYEGGETKCHKQIFVYGQTGTAGACHKKHKSEMTKTIQKNRNVTSSQAPSYASPSPKL